MTLKDPGLIEALWKNPGDRALLAVIADHFAETGSTTRAEYMQLALLSARSKEQERRMTSLLKRHRLKWLGKDFNVDQVATWEDPIAMSFVRRARCSVDPLIADFEAIRMLGPRLVVEVTLGKPRDDARLASLPLGRLHGLSFADAPNELLVEIAPQLTGLRELELRGDASAKTWKTVFSRLSGLRRLLFWPERSGWIDALLAAPFESTIEDLDLPLGMTAATRAKISRAFPRAEISA